jgi:hypothetical protein
MKKLLLLLLIGLGYHSLARTVVNHDDPGIRYMGRTSVKDGATILSWPGNSVCINFNGTSVVATLADEYGQSYYNVVIDGKVDKVIRLNQGKSNYILASGLAPGNHTLELYKRTEWVMGKTWFYKFELNDGGKLLPPSPAKKRKIEFYGDSITCGYADEDSTGQDRGTSPYENNYLSYDALIARHYDAELSCIARSGIGLTISAYHQIMPEMYHLADGSDPNSEWDFSKFTPGIVVINLFQNDGALVMRTEMPEYKVRFGDMPPTPEKIIADYQDFVKALRSKYPQATIIGVLGSMDAAKEGSPWPGFIKKAVAGLNDKKVFAYIFKYKGTRGHPDIKEHQDMANELIRFIDQKVKW